MLLNVSIVSKFVTRKWIEANDLSSGQYSVNNNIRFKTSALRLDLCDYSDTYIAVKARITVEGDYGAKTRNKEATFKVNVPFRSCISKISNTFISNAENLGIVSDSYYMTSRSLSNYYRDEVNNDANENNDADNKINNNETKTRKSFEFKTKIIGRAPDNNNNNNNETITSKSFE